MEKNQPHKKLTQIKLSQKKNAIYFSYFTPPPTPISAPFSLNLMVSDGVFIPIHFAILEPPSLKLL